MASKTVKEKNAQRQAAGKPASARAAAQNTGGGTPVASSGANSQQQTTDARLAQQREAGDEQRQADAEERTQQAASRRGDGFPTDGVFTAVCKNGLGHRRNGIIFGPEPVSVDTSNWTKAERQRFFNDSLLMIVAGRQLGAKGAILAPAASLPHAMGGSNAENATPDMLAAAERGQAMSHPSSGSRNPVIGASLPAGARDLEKLIDNNGDEE